MNETKQRTESAVLFVLCVVLGLVLYFQLILLPMINRCERLETEISEQKLLLSLAKADIAAGEEYEKDNALLKTKMNKILSELSGEITNEQLDEAINALLVKNGLTQKTAAIYAESFDSGIAVLTAEYTAAGSYSELLGFLTDMEKPYISVNRVEMKAITDDSKGATSAENMMFTVEISAFMLKEKANVES